MNNIKKILEWLRLVLIVAFILWGLYVNIIYRFTHPNATETQLTLKFFTFGYYNPEKSK